MYMESEKERGVGRREGGGRGKRERKNCMWIIKMKDELCTTHEAKRDL